MIPFEETGQRRWTWLSSLIHHQIKLVVVAASTCLFTCHESLQDLEGKEARQKSQLGRWRRKIMMKTRWVFLNTHNAWTDGNWPCKRKWMTSTVVRPEDAVAAAAIEPNVRKNKITIVIKKEILAFQVAFLFSILFFFQQHLKVTNKEHDRLNVLFVNPDGYTPLSGIGARRDFLARIGTRRGVRACVMVSVGSGHRKEESNRDGTV